MRITLERAESICELYDFKLRLGEYLDVDQQCGCNIGLMAVGHLGGVEAARLSIDYATLKADAFHATMAEALGTDTAYLVGLEAGFEGWIPEDIAGFHLHHLDTQEFWEGYIDGSEIGTAADKGELPLYSNPIVEERSGQRILRRETMRTRAFEAVANPEVVGV